MSETQAVTEFKSVKDYMLAVIATPILHWRPPAKGIFVNTIGLPEGQSLISIILDRRGQYQTEMFVATSATKEAYEHTHLGVDSVEQFLSGDLSFIVDNVIHANVADGRRIGERMFIEVPDNAPHSARITDGAAFLSFQFWKDEPPTTIGHKFEIITKGEKNG